MRLGVGKNMVKSMRHWGLACGVLEEQLMAKSRVKRLVVSDLGFHSAWVSQSPYPTLQPGQTSTPLNVVFRNTGSQTWTKGVANQEARLGINGELALNHTRRAGQTQEAWRTREAIRVCVQAIAVEPRVAS